MVDPIGYNTALLEEKLREAASCGDTEAVAELISRGVDVNAKNNINGWTALHWAARRGQKQVINLLLSLGADSSIKTLAGELPKQLTSQPHIQILLQSDGDSTCTLPKLPITPHYITYPKFNDKVELTDINMKTGPLVHTSCKNSPVDELVLKVRVANSGDPDYIEIEIPKIELTFNKLVKTCCEEFNIIPPQIARVRKLPNTILRKDKDVERLQDFQELEIVMSSPCSTTPVSPLSTSSSTGNPYESIHTRKNQTILY